VEALIELLDDHDVARTATHLVSLVQQQLIRADRSDLAGLDAFRFAHALIREAAYHALPKQRRADLHERVARWLERSPGAQDETIGHHLGEAYRLLADLGPVGERERALAAGAVERLGAAAGAARRRGEAPAGARLLERAAALMSQDDPGRTALLPRLGAALLEAGRLAEADDVLTEAIERAHDDSLLEARARVERQLVRLQAGSAAPIAETNEIADSALQVFEAHGDEHGQCRALWLRALHALVEGRLASADEDWQRAAEHARRADDEPALFEILGWRASAALFGPTPVPQGIARCREIQEQVRSSAVTVAHTCRPLAALQAMAGELEDADRLVRASDEILQELGGLHTAASQEPAMVDLLAGRPDAAEARLRRGYEALAEMGEKALLATTAAMLAQTLYAQGRHEEAGELCDVGEQAAAEEDLAAQVGWRSVRAKLLAREGRTDEAEALAAEAVRLAERTDFLTLRAEAQLDLAEVLGAGGRSDEAEAARQAARELYRQKGDVVSSTALAR
jgi:tetratricopeptide (TPR) repeat protein